MDGIDVRTKSAVGGDKASKTGQQGEFKMRQTMKKNQASFCERERGGERRIKIKVYIETINTHAP